MLPSPRAERRALFEAKTEGSLLLPPCSSSIPDGCRGAQVQLTLLVSLLPPCCRLSQGPARHSFPQVLACATQRQAQSMLMAALPLPTSSHHWRLGSAGFFTRHPCRRLRPPMPALGLGLPRREARACRRESGQGGRGRRHSRCIIRTSHKEEAAGRLISIVPGQRTGVVVGGAWL